MKLNFILVKNSLLNLLNKTFIINLNYDLANQFKFVKSHEKYYLHSIDNEKWRSKSNIGINRKCIVRYIGMQIFLADI